MDAHGPTAWVLGLQIGVLLLIVPMSLLTKSVAADDMLGWTFGFLNKRWLIGLYQTAIVALLLCPIAVLPMARAAIAAPRSVDRLTGGPGKYERSAGYLALVAVMW